MAASAMTRRRRTPKALAPISLWTCVGVSRNVLPISSISAMTSMVPAGVVMTITATRNSEPSSISNVMSEVDQARIVHYLAQWACSFKFARQGHILTKCKLHEDAKTMIIASLQ